MICLVSINQDLFQANLVRGLNNIDTHPSELDWEGNLKIRLERLLSGDFYVNNLLCVSTN